MSEISDKLRKLARLHPPGTRMVGGTGYGTTGVGKGVTSRDKLAYARQYYLDNKASITAAQREKRMLVKAQLERELKKLRQG